jgi:hypothetical protein
MPNTLTFAAAHCSVSRLRQSMRLRHPCCTDSLAAPRSPDRSPIGLGPVLSASPPLHLRPSLEAASRQATAGTQAACLTSQPACAAAADEAAAVPASAPIHSVTAPGAAGASDEPLEEIDLAGNARDPSLPSRPPPRRCAFVCACISASPAHA